MPDVLEHLGQTPPSGRSLALGQISRIDGDNVSAIIPSFNTRHEFGPMVFEHAADAAVGDPVLVGFDEQGSPWLVGWSGTVDMATQAELDALAATVAANATANAPVPIGGMLPWVGAGDPADTRFLLADGRAIVRAAYPAYHSLVAAAGYPDGNGNGTTTVNIPDMRGRSVHGPDDMGTAAGAAGRLASNNTRGAVGGTETTTGVAAHTHGVGTYAAAGEAAHTHGVGTYANAAEAAHTHGVGTYTVPSGGSGTSGNDNTDHTHVVSHDHPLQTGASVGAGGQATRGTGTVVDLGGGGAGAPVKIASPTSGGRSAFHQHSTPAHTHSVSGSSDVGSSHNHSLSGSSAAGSSHTHSLSGSSASAGSASVNIMSPYKVHNWIVRVA